MTVFSGDRITVPRRGFLRRSCKGRVFCNAREAGECGFGRNDGNSGGRGVGQGKRWSRSPSFHMVANQTASMVADSLQQLCR
jgi:hypothetical protein